MEKRWILIGTTIITLIVAGCGIPQEDYDAVIAERDTAQSEVTSLQSKLNDTEKDLATTQNTFEATESELTTAQSKIEKLESSLSSANSRATQTQGQYTSFKSNTGDLWDSFNKKRIVAEIILGYWNAANAYSIGEASEDEFNNFTTLFVTKTGGYVDAIGDAELSELWEDFILLSTTDTNASMYSLGKLTSLIIDGCDEDAEALSAKF